MAKKKKIEGSTEELKAKVTDLEKEIFSLRNELAFNRKLEKPHLLKEKRKEKARALTLLYREGLKNRELAKEAPQTFLAGTRGIAKGKTRSEDEKFEAKPTPAKTDFSVTSGITKTEKKGA